MTDQMQEKGGQVVAIGAQSFQIAKDRADVIVKLRDWALRQTRPEHWLDQNGNPFLDSRGTDWIARVFGMRTEVLGREKLWQDDDGGKYYLWITTVRVSLPGDIDSVEGIGAASSRDKFLGTETRSGRNVEELLEPNLILKSYTAAVRSATTRLLCLRGLTWEQLKEYGIGKESAGKVEYKSKGKGKEKTEPAKPADSTPAGDEPPPPEQS